MERGGKRHGADGHDGGMAEIMNFDFGVFLDSFPDILTALPVTLEIALIVMIAALGRLGMEEDHGVHKRVYGSDPDGLLFEVTWFVPEELADR